MIQIAMIGIGDEKEAREELQSHLPSLIIVKG